MKISVVVKQGKQKPRERTWAVLHHVAHKLLQEVAVGGTSCEEGQFEANI